jgi:hypothetical protein
MPTQDIDCRNDTASLRGFLAFASIEATAKLATFMRAARFEVPAGRVPTPVSRVTLRPTGGMPLLVWPQDAKAPFAHAA